MEYISRKLSINIRFQIFLLFMCAIGLSIIFFIYGLKFEEVCVFLGLFLLLVINILIDRGYRIGWDGQFLSYRDWGLKSFFSNVECKIDALNMTSVEGMYNGETSLKRAFYEFDYINVRAKGFGNKKLWLHPMSLDELHLKMVLSDIYRLNPRVFSQNVIDYMNSDRDM